MSGKGSEVSDVLEVTGDVEAGKAVEETTGAVVAEVETPEDSELASVEAEAVQVLKADAETKADQNAMIKAAKREEVTDHTLKERTRDHMMAREGEDHHATKKMVMATPKVEAAETTMTVAEAQEDQDQEEVAVTEDMVAIIIEEVQDSTTIPMLTLMERDQEEKAKEVAEEVDHVAMAQEIPREAPMVPEVEPTHSSHEWQSPEVR